MDCLKEGRLPADTGRLASRGGVGVQAVVSFFDRRKKEISRIAMIIRKTAAAPKKIISFQKESGKLADDDVESLLHPVATTATLLVVQLLRGHPGQSSPAVTTGADLLLLQSDDRGLGSMGRREVEEETDHKLTRSVTGTTVLHREFCKRLFSYRCFTSIYSKDGRLSA